MSDAERWDLKHTAAEGTPLQAADGFLVSVLDALELPAGTRALDLAAGRGRQTRELVRRGFDVEAWDVSPRGLEQLQTNVPGAAVRCVDLSTRPRPAGLFDLVVIVDFLDRELLADLQRLVVPGGHVVATTFTLDRIGARPSAAFCLKPGELEFGLPGFERAHSMETNGRAGWSGRRVLNA